MAGKGSVNKVILVGNLGADPETRTTPSGLTVAKISIATTDARKDKQTGQSVEDTEWHRVTTFGKLAEIVGKYLRKGSKVYIDGRLKTSKYEKEGQTHYSTEVIANEMTMLSGREQPQAQSQGYQQPAQGGAAQGGGGAAQDFNDDIPFNAYMRRSEYHA